MKTFLDQIAEELLKDGSTDFSDVCIVLPNRRAGVFFRDALSKLSNKAIWAPTILSIEDFVFDLAGTVKADRITLLFTFYQVYQKGVKDPQSLEMFANWAPTFLSDANEVDLNLIDAQDIFAQLLSVERIARWNPQNSEPSDFQKRHLEFVAQLQGFYSSLRETLRSKRLAYQGMAFRQVADAIESIVSASEWKMVWFAGFNAMTVSEEKIITAWLQSDRARMFWDMDSHYVDDAVHEAGHYIRKYLRRAGTFKLEDDFKWKASALSSEQKEIHLIAVQRNVAQAQVASSILDAKRRSDPDSGFSNTAVVLNDGNLLMPLLHALPVELQGVNITMGYGIQNSQSAAFIEKIFGLYDRFTENGNRFYHRNVASVLNDSFYLSLADSGQTDLQTQILKEKQIYLDPDYLATSKLNRLLFNPTMHSVNGFLKGLQTILAEVHENLMERQELQIEMEFLFLFDKQIKRLTDLMDEFGGIESVRTLNTFWRQLVKGEQLDFVGEPLHGLQIMGMLETRNLDFEEVIILGVNEGHLPSNSHAASYFTFDVRKAFGLACQNERDAVTAYHFYRLLQRARKVYLIYDQDTDSLGRGEVSRYVRQLQVEKPENIHIQEWNIEQDIPARPAAPHLEIAKGEQEYDRMIKHAESGFSPSALNTYRSCPLKYYFSYVAGYKEQEVLKEDIDHATFGTAVHNTLEGLYGRYLGKPLSEDILRGLLKQCKVALSAEFEKELALDKKLSGRNLLAFEVGLSYVKRVVEHDLQTIRSGNIITPLYLEDQLEATLVFHAGGEDRTVRLKGMADRIDRLSDGTVRLIDYKTGSFAKTNMIKHVDTFSSQKTDHAFQLLLYTLMFGQRHPEMKMVQPTVFYLRSKQVEHPVTVLEDRVEVNGVELLDYANARLETVLDELLDQQVPFCQTEDQTVCDYCEFNQVCQR